MGRVQGLCLAAGLLAVPVGAMAGDAPTIGAFEFMNSCAQCHGEMGKGGGNLAPYLTTPPPDLTKLQANNGGVFPVTHVFDMISNGGGVSGHGTQEMPAWGQRYRANAPDMLGPFGTAAEAEALARLRVLALVEYLSTIQAQ